MPPAGLPITLVAAFAVTATATAAFAAAEELLPHRAVYDLSLEDSTERSGVRRIEGRMVYEFDGSVCDGYTVNYRFVSRFETDDVSRLIDERTTTYEAPEGESFDFATRSYVDQTLDRESRGTARHDNGETHVTMESPEEVVHTLRESRFPTQHLIQLLENARAGRNFYETPIFDGSEEGSKVLTTTVIIGRRGALTEDDADHELLAAASREDYWPVDIAYFDKATEDGEELPEYRISFKLHENGLTRDLVMDYGEFSMTGKLVNLALFDPAPQNCNQ
jgi:hypothetical protein